MARLIGIAVIELDSGMPRQDVMSASIAWQDTPGTA